MNDEQLRSLLTRAKAYQSKQVAEAEHHLEEARQRVREAEVRLATWTNMAPFEIEKELAEDLRLQKAEEEAQSRKEYLEARHAAALRQAHEYGKGILPPQQFGSKHVSFAAIGSVVGALFAMCISSILFDLDSDLTIMVVGTTPDDERDFGVEGGG